MRTSLTCLLFLLLATQLLAQRQNVSGQIFGPDGRIPNVSVREVDANHRVYNHTKADQNGLFSFTVRDAQHSLQFYAPGYRTFTHKMLGQKSFRVTLERRRMLILPIKVDLAINEYPAGRTLLVLGERDTQLMQWENVVDASPTDIAPHEASDVHLAQSYTGSTYLPGGTKEEKTLYAYPHFQFTKANLEYLVAHPDELRRLAVDTYKADNYWNLYPTDQTADLLKQALEGVGH